MPIGTTNPRDGSENIHPMCTKHGKDRLVTRDTSTGSNGGPNGQENITAHTFEV